MAYNSLPSGAVGAKLAVKQNTAIEIRYMEHLFAYSKPLARNLTVCYGLACWLLIKVKLLQHQA